MRLKRIKQSLPVAMLLEPMNPVLKDLDWAVGEIERLQAMMYPLVFAPLVVAPGSNDAWGAAMDVIGDYVTDELGVTEDDWRKRKVEEESRDGRTPECRLEEI